MTDLTAAKSGAAMWVLHNDYGSTQNNGNLLSQTVDATGALGVSVTASIGAAGYDGVNRLLTNGESSGKFPQTYGYDSVGNHWVTNGNTLSTSFTPVTPNWFDGLTNRLASGSGLMQYDAGASGGPGNLTGMGGYALAYDAEGRQSKVTLGDSVTQYWYDGDGRRVKKQTGTGTPTVYVYDAGGQLAAEYGGSNAASGTQYLVQDHLGSTRMVVDGAGNCLALHDYLPFGEELQQGVGGRTGTCPYGGADGTTQRFSGKERDSETNLDYFGARYFSGAQGRWTSPDLVNVTDERLRNPSSTLNKYAYAANNPLKYVDPDGRDVTYFYDQGGIAGHSIVYAYNQANGDYAIEDFGPRVRAPIWLGHSMHETNTFQSPDDLRANLAALTIQTTPEVAQEVINYIRENPDPALWTAIGPNCSTTAWNVLRAAKLAHQGIFQRRANRSPKGVWENLVHQYNPSQSDVTPKNGKDYGTPQFNMFDLLWWSLSQSAPKATVTMTSCITEPDGTTHCTTK